MNQKDTIDQDKPFTFPGPDGALFTVRKNPDPTDTARAYLGYKDDTLTISAGSLDVAIRALYRKHVIGLPAGKLIDFKAFQDARDRKR